MMNFIKPKEVQDKLVKGGKILGEVLEKISKMAVHGISTAEIDKEAERLIKEAGGLPAFKGYGGDKYRKGFPGTVCVARNHELVHGVARDKDILKEGDIFSMDIGMQWPRKCGEGENKNGYFTDTALTVAVGKIPEKTQGLMNVTKKALEIGIDKCRAGNKLSDIGEAIQDYVDPKGYGIVRDLIGHGVGFHVHEEPRVPNFYDSSLKRIILKAGMVLALEPMITMGGGDIVTADDDWTIETADKSLCAHFEHTVIITEGDPIVVTRRPLEK
ncbi:MAG: type I methionyl aminopeptidase [Candidatus Magasanikbacteria bacterium]|nr:type I methionyl aminopeptidase [Candidatus Magasanikbacteria bacterium]